MKRQKRDDKPVLLRLPTDIFERVAIAAHEKNVSRTQFLRQSVLRNLNHYEQKERAIFQRLTIGGMS